MLKRRYHDPPKFAPLCRRAAASRASSNARYWTCLATTLGLDDVGLPISSDPIESLFGLAKQHGVGEIQDANCIALRLPALCGTPTREEARQGLDVSVAEQQAIPGRFPSLTQQRREVLPNPDALESLGEVQAYPHVELIPSSKNWSNSQAIPSPNSEKGQKQGFGKSQLIDFIRL